MEDLTRFSYHGLQPGTEGGGQAGQQLHGRLCLALAVEQGVTQPLATQDQQLGAQDVLVLHLQHGLGERRQKEDGNIQERAEAAEEAHLLSSEVQALAEELTDQLASQDVWADLQQGAQFHTEGGPPLSTRA